MEGGHSSFQLLFTDAKTWRKMLLLFSASFPTDFFFHQRTEILGCTCNLDVGADICV